MARRSSGDRNIDAFPLDTSLTKPARIAAFLAWWAKQHPYDFAAYNEILKAIEGFKKLPRMDTKDVESVRECTGRAEKILRRDYQRELIRHRGLGARASVDSLDVIQNKQVTKARRMHSAAKSFIDTDNLIDVRSIPDTAAARPWKHWYQRDAGAILKMVNSEEFLGKLLPAAAKDEKK